jgi:hypothetical protein
MKRREFFQRLAGASAACIAAPALVSAAVPTVSQFAEPLKEEAFIAAGGLAFVDGFDYVPRFTAMRFALETPFYPGKVIPTEPNFPSFVIFTPDPVTDPEG